MVINQANMMKVAQALRSGEFTQARGTLNRAKVPGWISEALADPGSHQHQQALDDNEKTLGQCCLGVACEIAVREEVVQRRLIDHDDRNLSVVYEYGNFGADPNITFYSDSFLPKEVQLWLGVPSGDILFQLEGEKLQKALAAGVEFYNRQYDRDGKLVVSASVLNDRMGFTFDDMADLFESGKVMSSDLTDAAEVPRS